MNKYTKEKLIKNRKKRKIKDKIYNSFTYLASTIGLFTLVAILFYVFSNGMGLLNIGLLTGNYHSKVYSAQSPEILNYCDCESNIDFDSNTYYSKKWGIALSDIEDREGKSAIQVLYVNPNSPFSSLVDKATDETISVSSGTYVNKALFGNNTFALSKKGAENMIQKLDNADNISEISFQTLGGGIRGSLITTGYMIVLTLALALPVGIATAIYLNEFAKKNRITKMLRGLIEMLTGVPSIVFGLMGAAVFIPLTSKIGGNGGNILSGALTLSVILLPTIIRSTEEALKIVPAEYRSASLAVGANYTQTTFKVVLPSAVPGIMTATLLGIGRIVGESAALIYAVGTAIKDEIFLTEKSTTLAVHIWTVMSEEVPNFELATAIAIIILIFVLILNILVKLFTRRLNRAWY